MDKGCHSASPVKATAHARLCARTSTTMSVPRIYSRLRTLLLALFLVSVFTWSFSRWRSVSVEPGHKNPSYVDSAGVRVLHSADGHIHFWQQFQPLLAKYQPKCDPPMRLGNAPSVRFEEAKPEDRREYLDMLPDEVEAMKNAHTGFVRDIKSNPPQLHYVPNTRGLVSTAGGSYLPVLVISLRMLRKTGSELPVEVFWPTKRSMRSIYAMWFCRL